MSQQKLLEMTVGQLRERGIEYMVTGSYASSLQGEPRLTHDVDIVVMLPDGRVTEILEMFPEPDYYVEEEAVRLAIQSGKMFNVLHIPEGDKIDFWILTNEPFDRSRFARRIETKFTNFKYMVSSPEDTILAKLRWSKKYGGSEKQLTDALRVYEVQYDNLEQTYLDYWARELDLRTELENIRSRAEIG